MVKQTNSRAQGTIEYLVIIAVVIVIALVVVALILNMTDYDQVQIMSNKNQNLIGKGGISIIDSAINSSGEGVILFQNTLGESLTIKSITPGAESSCEKMLSSGTKYSCYLTNIDSVCPCNAKERVICDFKINFETKEGIQKSETFTIINDCTDQPITNPNNNLLINLISPNSGTIVTSLDSNTNFNFRANKVTTDCNLYIKTNSTWNFAENRNATTAKNTLITIDANVASFGTNVNSWKIKCTDEENNTGESIDRSITYSPETPPTTYTVTFDSQGGSSIDPISGIQSGATIILPTNPTKTGYTFVEWNTQANGLGTEFTASTQVTQNIIIYAQWEEEIGEFDCDEPLAGGYFCNGSGTEEDPYGITTIQMLQDMNKDLDASYILLNDIDATQTLNWNGGAGFEPIGNSTTKFTGSLDGNSFTISNLYINRPSTENIGLFGYVTGSIQNLNLVDVNIYSLSNYAAGLVSRLGNATSSDYASVSNCSVTGNVNGKWYAAGLVATMQFYSNVSNSYSTADVNGLGYVGGLVGLMQFYSNISNSYSTGDVNGLDGVGGLVGITANGTAISNSYSNSIVFGNTKSGGFVGHNLGGPISNSYSTGKVTGSTFSNGFVGIQYIVGTILNSYWDTSLSGKSSCFSTGYDDSNTGCNWTNDTESYYYSSSNSPLSSWTWGEDGNWTARENDYPILTWQVQ